MIESQAGANATGAQRTPRLYFVETLGGGLEGKLTEDGKNYYYGNFATNKRSYARQAESQATNLDPTIVSDINIYTNQD